MACGYWLDPEVPLPPRTSTEASAEGDRVHKLVEEDDGGRLEGLEQDGVSFRSAEAREVDPAVLTARRYISAHVGRRPMEREAAYGWDGVRADYLGRGRGVYETFPGLVVAGTVDLVAMMGRRRWRVTDWKNGEHGTTHAAEQLRTLAALVLDTTGGDECEMHAVWLQGDGNPMDYGTLSAMEGDAHLATLRTLGPTEPRPGDHCSGMYCPLVGRCPAFVEAASLVPVSALTARRNPLVTGVKTEEDAAVAVELLGLVEERVEAVKQELRSFVLARGGRLELPDGRAYGPSSVTRKGGIDGTGAYALAEKLGASKEDLARLQKPSGTYERWSVTGRKTA